MSERKCPKCGGKMEERGEMYDHNLSVKGGKFGIKRRKMYVCGNGESIEFYFK